MGFKKISEYALAALFTLVALCITISTVVYLLGYTNLSSPASYLYDIGKFLFNSFHIVSFVLAIYFFTAAFLLIIEHSSIVLFVELVFVSFPILLFTVGIKILFDGGGGGAPITRYAIDLFGRNGGIIISFLLSATLFLLTFYLRNIFNQTPLYPNHTPPTNQQPSAPSSSSLKYDLAAPLVQINTNQHPYSIEPTKTHQTTAPQQPMSHTSPAPYIAPHPHKQMSQTQQPQQPQRQSHHHSQLAPQNHSTAHATNAINNAHNTTQVPTRTAMKKHRSSTKPLSFKHENDIPSQYAENQTATTDRGKPSAEQYRVPPAQQTKTESENIETITETAPSSKHNNADRSYNNANAINTNTNSFVPLVDHSYLNETKDIEEAIDDDIPSLVLKDGKISVAAINNSERYLSKIPHNISNVLPKSYQNTDDAPSNRFKSKENGSGSDPTTSHVSPSTASANTKPTTTQNIDSNTKHTIDSQPNSNTPAATQTSISSPQSNTSTTTPQQQNNRHSIDTSHSPSSLQKSHSADSARPSMTTKQSTTYPVLKSTTVDSMPNHTHQSPQNASIAVQQTAIHATQNTSNKSHPTPPHMVTTKSEHGASHTTHIDNVDALIDAIDSTVASKIIDNTSSTEPPTSNTHSAYQHDGSEANRITSSQSSNTPYHTSQPDVSRHSATTTNTSASDTIHDLEPVIYNHDSPDIIATDTQPHDIDIQHSTATTTINAVATDAEVEFEPVTQTDSHTLVDTITSTVPTITVPSQSWSLNAYQSLIHYPSSHEVDIDRQTQSIANKLKITLAEFNIEAEIVGIRQGPVVTVYELLPAKGIKVAKISSLADNIALRLAAERVRIVAPIPGKQAIGIELPNKHRQTVGFDTIIQDPQFNDRSLTLPIGLGRGIGGDVACIDLSKTPHLLIAGSTGSGKSVCVNSIICSLMFSCSPVDVRMILIDPKIVELKVYNHIPHLLTPVITDTNRAAAALNYALTEMERRYELLDQQGVRDISGYNQIIDNEDETRANHMPYIVIIIDEFADLMHTGGKQIELTISRLAAMARAVGIHLVLATQRPSADVITGLIKANIPTRIAFMVSSKVDSRIILDISGAEQLLGRGDMLFVSSWDPNPIRIQGSLITDQEVKHIADAARQNGSPSYISEEDLLGTTEQNGAIDDNDPLYQEAVAVVRSTGKASASYLQRRLQVGYNRAARLIETMEHHGIVGPANGSKAREVLG